MKLTASLKLKLMYISRGSVESLAMLFEIDTEKHQKHWEYIVPQVVALADAKKPQMAKKINKAALGTQLTLLSQESEEIND
jgi:hypothetical protein